MLALVGLCAEDDNKVVQIAIVQLIFRTRVVLLVVLVLVSGSSVVCGTSAYSWLLPLGGLWAISVLQAEGRASSAAVRMKLIAVVCDQPVQLVVFFCLFATKNNINLKFVEMIV